MLPQLKPKESDALLSRDVPSYQALAQGSPGTQGSDSPCFGAVDGQGPNGVPLTAALLIADVIGAGILSAAVAIAQLGWLLGTIVVVVLLAMNVHTSVLMWRVRMCCPQAHTFTGLVEVAFASDPPRQRDAIVAFTGFCQFFSLFGVLCLYTVSFGKSLGMSFYDVHACLPTWTTLGCLLLMPLMVTSRSMGSLPSLMWVNLLTIVGTVAIPLWEMARRMEHGAHDYGERHAVAPMSFATTVAGISAIAFAFSSQFLVVEIMSEMREPAKFPRAYGVSAPFQCFVLLLCGLGGYYFVGSNARGMILDNIPFGLNLQLAAACLLLHMLVTCLLKGIVFCRAIHTWCDRDGANEGSARGWALWGAIVTATLALTWVVAQVVPFFNDFVELLGGTCTPMCSFVIPIGTYLRWLRASGSPEQAPSRLEWLAIAAELTVALLLMVAVPILSAERIGGNWSQYGAPFACHCERLWNTCECSAARPGMEECPAGAGIMSAF